MLEVRDIIRPDGTTERAYRIGTRDWVTCTSFEHSTVHVDAGPWRTLEDVPDSVFAVTDHDGSRWVRDDAGWMCTESIHYESRVYAPFVLDGARRVTPAGEVEAPASSQTVSPPRWTPSNSPSWYDLSEREFNR